MNRTAALFGIATAALRKLAADDPEAAREVIEALVRELAALGRVQSLTEQIETEAA